jgi:hypothetical protein
MSKPRAARSVQMRKRTSPSWNAFRLAKRSCMDRNPASTQHEYLFSLPFSILPVKPRPPPKAVRYFCKTRTRKHGIHRQQHSQESRENPSHDQPPNYHSPRWCGKISNTGPSSACPPAKQASPVSEVSRLGTVPVPRTCRHPALVEPDLLRESHPRVHRIHQSMTCPLQDQRESSSGTRFQEPRRFPATAQTADEKGMETTHKPTRKNTAKPLPSSRPRSGGGKSFQKAFRFRGSAALPRRGRLAIACPKPWHPGTIQHAKTKP